MTPAVSAMVLLFTGLFAGPGQASGKPADPDVTLTGCVIVGAEPETFILHDARKDPADPLERGSDYLLVSVDNLKFKSHVTHVVRITGDILKADARAGTQKESELPRLNVKELAMATGTCAEDPSESESDTGDDSEDTGSGSSGGRIGFAELGAAGMFDFPMGSFLGRPMSSAGFGSGSSGDFASDGGVGRISSLSLGSGSSSGLATTSGSGAGQIGSVSAGVSSFGWSALPYDDPNDPNGSTSGSLTGLTAATVGPTIAVNTAAAQLGIAVPTMTTTSFSSTANGTVPIVNPEPASLVLLGTGLLLAASASRRRLRRK